MRLHNTVVNRLEKQLTIVIIIINIISGTFLVYWYNNTFCPISWIKQEFKIPFNKLHRCMAKISAHSIKYSFKIQSFPKAF